MLNAAEVYIHPLGEFDEAISMCDLALDLAETDDEVVDGLLLKFDALLGKGELDGARAVCERFPSGPFENPNHLFLVGRAYHEVGDIPRAFPLIEEAVKRNPKNAEAWYYLGLVRDERGDAATATVAFLRSRELDLEIPPPPWSLSRAPCSRAGSAWPKGPLRTPPRASASLPRSNCPTRASRLRRRWRPARSWRPAGAMLPQQPACRRSVASR